MQHPGTDIGSLGPCWGKEEQTASTHVPLMIETLMSHNSKILAFVDNSVSCAQADGNGNMSFAPSGYKPQLGLSPDSRDPVLEIRTK